MLQKKSLGLVSALLLSNSLSFAAINSQLVEYKVNDTVMEGYLAYDDTITTPRAGILIVPDWMGLGNFNKEKAQQLAKKGFVAFAADVYGKNIRPKDTEEATKLVNSFKNDRPLLRQHIRAAFDKLAALPQVNPNEIVVIGYCFGGTTALELARSGAPVVGTVSFHGGLFSPTPQDAKNIHGKVLALHGADDPLVPPSEVSAFKAEMKAAQVDLTFIAYPGVVHAFTNPAAGNDKSTGIAYNAEADKASWQSFEKFLTQVIHPV